MIDISSSMHQRGNFPHLIGYLPSLYPDVETYRKLLTICAEQHLRYIEIGIPVSHPYLDGKIISDALQQVLSSGYTDLRELLSLSVSAVRDAHMYGIVMLYYETVVEYGIEKFTSLCIELAVDAILIPNIPLQVVSHLSELLQGSCVKTVHFIPHEAPDSVITSIMDHTTGFIYFQSMNGTTGGRFVGTQKVQQRVTHVMYMAQEYNLPVALGFGISSPSDAQEASLMGSDAIIVGTGCVDAANGGVPALKEFLSGFSDFLYKESV